MRASHRTLVGAGVGVLAMSGVASSVAFACTPFASMTVNGSNTTLITTPGTTVVVDARRYSETNGPVFISWNEPTKIMITHSTRNGMAKRRPNR